MIKRIVIALVINGILFNIVYTSNQDGDYAISNTLFIMSIINMLISLSSFLGKSNVVMRYNPNRPGATSGINLAVAHENIKRFHKDGTPLKEVGRFNPRLSIYLIISILYLIPSIILIYV